MTSGGTSGYVSTADVDAAVLVQQRRTWWPFLVAGLVTWGCLPRVIAYAAGSWLAGRAAHRVPLKHMAVQHLFERLFPPQASWSGPDPDAVRSAAPVVPKARTPAAPAPRAARSSGADEYYAVCWGTLFANAGTVEQHLARRFQRKARKTLGAGLADLDIEKNTVKTLAKRKASRIVLTLPEGQQPTRDVMRFLADLRDRVGDECELIVGLLAVSEGGFDDVDGDEVEEWRNYLLAAADPYLTIQKMRVPS